MKKKSGSSINPDIHYVTVPSLDCFSKCVFCKRIPVKWLSLNLKRCATNWPIRLTLSDLKTTFTISCKMVKSVFKKILIFRVSQKKGSKNSNIEKRSKKGPKITMFCRLSQLYQNEPSSFFIKAILNVRDRAIKNQKRLWVLLEPFLNIRLFRTLFWDYIFKKKKFIRLYP